MKHRVQSYIEFKSWKKKALPFLKKEEAWNNLFWQIIQQREKSPKNSWSGNVFYQGTVCLTALHTDANFLLFSQGSTHAVEEIAKYAIKEQWLLKGLSGPQSIVDSFIDYTKIHGQNYQLVSKRIFKLFQTSSHNQVLKFEDYKLGLVRTIDWARARIWAQQFALESDPPMDLFAITNMAERMHKTKNLYMLTNSQNYPIAMAGFGRSTQRYKVINMVYVPKEMRGLGIGKELITRMCLVANDLGYEECLLFSEWLGPRNLYDSLACKNLGGFVEYDLV